MTGRIVVGVDGSDGARSALAWGLEEARIRGASLDAVYACTVNAFAYLPMSPGVAFNPEDLHHAGQDVLAKALASVDGTDVVVRTLVVEGPSAPVLLDAAKEADLLVVGSRGLGGFAGLLLGSTSHQVAHHAPCPVVIVGAQGPAA